MQEREREIIVFTGERGRGKSYKMIWDIVVPYAKGLLNGGIPQKVLMIDTQNELGSTTNPNSNTFPKTDKHKKLTSGRPLDIKAIDVNDVAKFASQQRVEIRRISFFYTKTTYDKKGVMLTKARNMMSPEDKVKTLMSVVQNFHHGLLFIDDIRVLFQNSIPADIISLILSCRHNNTDVAWNLQSCGRMLPEFWEQVNKLCYFHEKGSIDYHEGKLREKYPMFKICESIVNGYFNNGFPRFSAWCDMDEHRIKGMFTKEVFMWAVECYIKQTPSSTKSLEREKNDSGKKRYTYDQCIKLKKEELFRTYYGN